MQSQLWVFLYKGDEMPSGVDAWPVSGSRAHFLDLPSSLYLCTSCHLWWPSWHLVGSDWLHWTKHHSTEKHFCILQDIYFECHTYICIACNLWWFCIMIVGIYFGAIPNFLWELCKNVNIGLQYCLVRICMVIVSLIWRKCTSSKPCRYWILLLNLLYKLKRIFQGWL